jgi:diguanylate cyclase (GGDEF)-like protein/putative nucleotidyltransferase with HDIG domain
LDLAQKCVLSEYRDALDKALLNLISKQEKYDLEFKIKCLSTGEEKFVHSNAVLLVDENDNSAKVVGTIQDITNYKKAQEKIEYISYHNALTGLYNRRKFEIDLEKTNKSGIYPVSIIMGDINGLKLVNDAFGHNNGDKLLKKMAQILKDECGDNASVARHGGDEFAVILPNTSYDEAYLIVNNIKNRCDSETTNKLVLNISIGIATKSEKNDDLYKCYRLAEERMYASKLLEAKSTRSAIITNLRTAMEEKTGETKRHSERTAKLAEKMGELLGMQSFEIEFLKLLAILHDIGKTGIPDNILLKPSPLNDEEWKAMKRHCEIGFRIASTMPELVSIAEAILSHHESWDGSGYPHNLKGEEIPLMSRIIAVIDSFDAMTNDRPYKKAISKEEAVEKLLQGSGTQFDPSIVDLFVNKALND